MEDVISPLQEFERIKRDELRDIIEGARTERDILEKRFEQCKKTAVKEERDGANERQAKELASELASFSKPTSYPKVFVSDVTPERAEDLLLEQGERIGIFAAESRQFGILAGRYQNLTNIDIFLNGHSGDTHKVERQSRITHLHRPAITFGIMVQPAGIREAMKKAPILEERGFWARFNLVYPRSYQGYRSEEPPQLDEQITAAYHRAIWNLLDIRPERDESGRILAYRLRLSEEGREIFRVFRQDTERRRHPEGDLCNIETWGGKHEGRIVRIACILHLMTHHERPAPWQVEISGDTMRKALAFSEYLIAHAKKTFATMEADPQVEGAKYVLAWITRERKTSFTKRDLHRHAQGKYQNVEDLSYPLRLLEQRGYIRKQRVEETPSPGRPSEVFEVNPLIFNPKKKVDNIDKNHENAGHGGDSVNFVNEFPGVQNSVAGGREVMKI
jgi:hypothetical protein